MSIFVHGGRDEDSRPSIADLHCGMRLTSASSPGPRIRFGYELLQLIRNVSRQCLINILAS